MKVEYHYGCTSSSITVDGQFVDEDHFDKQKLLEVANLILNKLDQSSLEYTVKELIQGNATETEDFGRCDQCGDYPCTYKLEI